MILFLKTEHMYPGIAIIGLRRVRRGMEDGGEAVERERCE